MRGACVSDFEHVAEGLFTRACEQIAAVRDRCLDDLDAVSRAQIRSDSVRDQESERNSELFSHVEERLSALQTEGQIGVARCEEAIESLDRRLLVEVLPAVDAARAEVRREAEMRGACLSDFEHVAEGLLTRACEEIAIVR